MSDSVARNTDIHGLYEREAGRLRRVAFLLTGSAETADDVVQEAFAGLLRRWPDLADVSRAAGYLRVTVVNGARSVGRRRRIDRMRARAKAIEIIGADGPVLLSEEHEYVALAVRALPRRQGQVIAMRYWLDLDDEEIAAALGVSQGTIRATASKALTAIEAYLGRHYA